MLMPSRLKHRKAMRGRNRGTALRGTEVSFGEFGLQAIEPVWLESRQIEAARRVITRYVRRGGKVWIRVFPDKPVTKKPAETRMGKGKGAPDHYVAVIKPGHVIFELAGVPEEMAKEAMRLASYKLPVKTRFLVRDHEAGVDEGVYMTTKYTRELRLLDDAELHRRLDEAKAELTGIRFGLATRQTENTARLGQAKRRDRPDHHDPGREERGGLNACQHQDKNGFAWSATRWIRPSLLPFRTWYNTRCTANGCGRRASSTLTTSETKRASGISFGSGRPDLSARRKRGACWK